VSRPRGAQAAYAALLVLLPLLLAIAPRAVAAKASPGPGCDISRRAVAYTPGGTSVTPAAVLPCLVVIPGSVAAGEAHLVRTARDDLVYEAATIAQSTPGVPPPYGVLWSPAAVSHDDGATWTRTGFETAQNRVPTFSTTDASLYRDPTTDRVFWAQLGGAPPPQTAAAFSDDGGRHWTVADIPCCHYQENARLLAAKPVVSKPLGYANVLYYCTNTSFVGGIIGPAGARVCFKSLDGGKTWPSLFPLAAKTVGLLEQCRGQGGEEFGPLDGYYPQADRAGTLYVMLRCGLDPVFGGQGPGPDGYLLRSRDEGQSWFVVSTLPPLPAGYDGKEELRIQGDTFALLRGTPDAILLSVSKDSGRRWSKPQNIVLPGSHGLSRPVWSVTTGAGGRLAVAYAAQQGRDATLRAFLVQTADLGGAHPRFIGAALKTPTALPAAAVGYDFTDVVLDGSGTPWAAFPLGWVGRLAPLRG
jgi:hypothetical protein